MGRRVCKGGTGGGARGLKAKRLQCVDEQMNNNNDNNR